MNKKMLMCFFPVFLLPYCKRRKKSDVLPKSESVTSSGSSSSELHEITSLDWSQADPGPRLETMSRAVDTAAES